MLKILKWAALIVLAATNTLTAFFYRRIRKYWSHLPVVAATVTHCSLDDYLTVEGGRKYRANIRFTYEFNGKTYESRTPALRGPQVFPLWNYEWEMVQKYKVGQQYEARVVPSGPELAYLEIAPFSWVSAVFLPILTALYAVVLLVYWWYVVYAGRMLTDLF